MGPGPTGQARCPAQGPQHWDMSTDPPAHPHCLQGWQCRSTRSWWEPEEEAEPARAPPGSSSSPLSAQQLPPDAEVAVGLATPCGDSDGGEDRGPTTGEKVLASPRGFRALSGGAEALGAGGPWPKHPKTQGMGRSSGSDALPLQNPPPWGLPPSPFLQCH